MEATSTAKFLKVNIVDYRWHSKTLNSMELP
jgi:hypothetical protein